MEMKQCPNCGKYVAADRTYCMNCGTTLGIRCPSCNRVVPVGTKVCTGCGNPLAEKKKRQAPPIWLWMKKHARTLLCVASVALTVLLLVAAALPSLSLAPAEGSRLTGIKLSGYDLVGYFLGSHPTSITAFLEASELEDSRTALQPLLYGIGFGWLTAMVASALCAVLLLPNRKRISRRTLRRLWIPLGIAAAGGVGAWGLSQAFVNIALGACVDEGGLALITSAFAAGQGGVFILPLLMAALTAVLHIGAFGKVAESEKELSLGALLRVPFSRGYTLCRRAWRAITRKKAKNGDDEPRLTVTHTGTTYLILLGASLVFTQALRSKVSHIFFWFVFLLPCVLLVYTIISAHALSFSMLSDTTTTEKNTPYTYEFRIDNHSPLAIPFIDAAMVIPQSNNVRCTERSVRLSMAPLTGYHIKNTVSFRFRGTYDIGVRQVYVYDFLRIFRYRVDVVCLSTVYVLPRRLTADEAAAMAVSDSTARTVRSPLVLDRLEVSDIRDYQAGDSLKSIHWKLSSKSEDFIVKDYNTGTSDRTVVFCDLGARFPEEPPKAPEAEKAPEDNPGQKRKKTRSTKKKSKTAPANGDKPEASPAELPRPDVHALTSPVHYEDMNEYLADGVVELTIASVLSELRRGHEVLLLWFDRRSDTGVCAYPLRGADSFESIYHLFATAPLCSADKRISSLVATVTDIQSAKQLFVIPTLSSDELTDLCSLPGVSDAGSFGSAEVILYNPEERFANPQERAAYIEGCASLLAAGGMTLTARNLPYATATEGGVPHEA